MPGDLRSSLLALGAALATDLGPRPVAPPATPSWPLLHPSAPPVPPQRAARHRRRRGRGRAVGRRRAGASRVAPTPVRRAHRAGDRDGTGGVARSAPRRAPPAHPCRSPRCGSPGPSSSVASSSGQNRPHDQRARARTRRLESVGPARATRRPVEPALTAEIPQTPRGPAVRCRSRGADLRPVRHRRPATPTERSVRPDPTPRAATRPVRRRRAPLRHRRSARTPPRSRCPRPTVRRCRRYPVVPAADRPGRHRAGAVPGAARAGARSSASPIAVALVAGLVGGLLGGALADRGRLGRQRAHRRPAPEREPRPGRTASVANIAARATPSVVTLQGHAAPTAPAPAPAGSIDGAGHIVTNNHVVAGAADSGKITVVLADGRRWRARSSAATGPTTSPSSRSTAPTWRPLTLGASKDVVVGDQVIAVGAPLGPRLHRHRGHRQRPQPPGHPR